MIAYRVNNITQEKKLPVSWYETSFAQLLELSKPDEKGNIIHGWAKILSVFSGYEEDVIKRAEITGLHEVMNLMSFVKKQCPYHWPERLLFYQIPKDIGFETIAQYEDLRATLKDIEGKSYYEQLATYPLICAIYTCKYLSRERCEKLKETYADVEYGKYHYAKAEVMKDEFLNCPAPEVLGVGNFTLLNLIGLNLGINPIYQKPLTRWKKLKLALRRWLLRLDLKGRLKVFQKDLASATKT